MFTTWGFWLWAWFVCSACFVAGVLIGMGGYRKMLAQNGYVIIPSSMLAMVLRVLHCKKENEYDG